MFRARVRPWQRRITAGLVLMSAAIALMPAQAADSQSGIELTTLATRFLDEAPPDRRWVLRRGHPLNGDAHAHAGGFIYAAVGRSYLVVDHTQGSLMEAGRAAWAPGGIGHLHTSPFRASNSGRQEEAANLEIWTILLERENDVRQPGASAISPPLRGLVPGPYEARLVAMTFQPGAATAIRRRTGPELAYTLDGSWELEYAGAPFTLGAGQGYLADPGVPHRLRNSGGEPARLLSAQLVPAGRPAEEPAP
jgi:quercetin dioxygenase-like cupin family protein